MNDEERGMYAKYRVFKMDDELAEAPFAHVENRLGQFHVLTELTTPFFVLQFDDPAAQDALWVYANSVKDKYPQLAADIKEGITQAVERSLAKTEYGVWNRVDETITPAPNRNEALVQIMGELHGAGDIVYRESGTDEWLFETPKAIG